MSSDPSIQDGEIIPGGADLKYQTDATLVKLRFSEKAAIFFKFCGLLTIS